MGVLFFLGLAALASVYADDSCPPASAISPCTCDGEGVNCMAASTIDQIRKAFKANFKYGGVRSVWIQSTPITSIPGDLFSNITCQEYYLEINSIASVDMKAFAGSFYALRSLSFFGNKLKTFDYSSLSMFINIWTINLGRNELTTIPANAFSHYSIGVVILSENKISSIGTNAFKGLDRIQKIELTGNSLTTLGAYSFDLKSHSPGLQISLSNNEIASIHSTAFAGTTPQVLLLTSNKLASLQFGSFGDLVTRMAQQGGLIEISDNRLTCLGCDFEWIVMNKHFLNSMLLGFQCTNGKTLQQLTRLDIKC